MKGRISVSPLFGRVLGGEDEGYVILNVPGVGIALTVQSSRELREELEAAEQAVIQAQSLAANRVTLRSPVKGSA